jgi:hypothetical protein
MSPNTANAYTDRKVEKASLKSLLFVRPTRDGTLILEILINGLCARGASLEHLARQTLFSINTLLLRIAAVHSSVPVDSSKTKIELSFRKVRNRALIDWD